LIVTKGYTEEQLPTQQTLNRKLNLLGYCLSRVAKCRPQKEQRSDRGLNTHIPHPQNKGKVSVIPSDALALLPDGDYNGRHAC
jgi:hypothetical protein